jgi:hypothetical protein
VASLFVEQLGLGYDRWKMQHGIALPAAQPAAPLKASAASAPARLQKSPRHGEKRTQ